MNNISRPSHQGRKPNLARASLDFTKHTIAFLEAGKKQNEALAKMNKELAGVLVNMTNIVGAVNGVKK